jgi:hypothetical protein
MSKSLPEHAAMLAIPAAAQSASHSMYDLRPSDNPARGRPKSTERKIVEDFMRKCAVALPLVQIAARTGLSRGEVRKQITNVCKSGLAHNTTPGNRTAMYIGGAAPAPEAAQRTERFVKPGNYDGRELQPFSARPAAMDAFDKPSVVGGVATPRKRPIINGSRVSEARVR